MRVTICEQAPESETLLLNGAAPTASSDDGSDEETEVTPSAIDLEFGRTTDTVRMYMRAAGGNELLNRAGEVQIAKRTERIFIK
ncbi:sigma 70 (RpoD) [Caballeronia arationis]|jgi:RNA polymerase primary sigma factor|nr:sigma 70 (RpoD) [Caballeronia arationis]